MSFSPGRTHCRLPGGKLIDKNGKEPKPGDMIEIFRDLYQHWAVYVGNGYVVHFSIEGGQSGSGTAAGKKGSVRKGLLKDAGKWKVNNYLDEEYEPRPSDEIVKKACSLVGSNLTYSLGSYNCEHFATEQRYGRPESRQAENLKAGIEQLSNSSHHWSFNHRRIRE
ncbi:phospholipase A and acyltransferase 3-like [Cyprinodon tularosa]|uniref:phospholipase A and acyltransferase 3-like n=1 Tax=Cyprinodon tularosa TaxID=77115 RepID=UPI0018E28187|nr:phospholipase A and acyltransferase 3-like [Cyprinodon tularosa]XP_038139240.1 phospholipase A and acyltransferase 3-like [Cyprinodon tularosa]